MRDKEKITYEIDPHNRLIARKTGPEPQGSRASRASGVTGFRKVLDGRFEIGKGNTLTYHVKKSSDSDTPQQIKLSGNYSLDKNHNLVFTLNKWSNQVMGNRLVIKGGLLKAKGDELVFTVGTRDSAGNAKVYILKLSGSWKADKYNRLSFSVSREGGAEDNLTLEGAWRINDNNQIVYTYTKSRSTSKEAAKGTLTFEGYWDITQKHRISYVLNKEINSAFDFRIGLLKAAKKGLEYKINIGAAPLAKTFVLSGEWKPNRAMGLLLEIPYEGRAVKSIAFGATCSLSGKDTLELRLKSSRGKKLDASLRLSRKILKDQGEAFIQALKEGKGLSLLSGIGFRW